MSNDKLSFVLGIHCHQPVGNFGWVIEEAFEKSYQPFIESLRDFPDIKITAHYSGCLLEWIEENRPEYLELIRTLVEQGQMEILGSGFYEPILMIIPRIDRLEQIQMMNNYAEKMLGMKPVGAWLTERIWEPSLPGALKDSGIRYTLTDDSHFLQAGIPRSEVHGYYNTEDEGDICSIFPIDQNLRYAVPFKDPEVTVAYLRERYEAGDRTCYTLIDDGEKFGLWPGTHKLLYTEEMWLKRFFELLTKQSDWLEITTPAAYMEANRPQGLVYLPTASYFEMGEWTLGPEDNICLEELKKQFEEEFGDRSEVYLGGGFFRNFFTRYPESNHMHKRMLEVSKKIHRSGLEGELRARAKRDLFRAQCNCAYWHGVFGGLYLPHLRDAIYENIIKAERQVEDRDLSVEFYDLLCDGKDEINLRNRELNALIAPGDGGSLIELDSVPYAANVINTLARRKEAYHTIKEAEHDENAIPSIHDVSRVLTEEERKLLVYDQRRRVCFRDILLPDGDVVNAENLRDLSYHEIGKLSHLEYTPQYFEHSDKVDSILSAETMLNDVVKLVIGKHYTLQTGSSRLGVRYQLELKEGMGVAGTFVVGFNFSTPSALGMELPFAVDGKEVPGCSLLDIGSAEAVSVFRLRDPHRRFDLLLDIDTASDIIWHPVETISQSESGFERNYQASAAYLILPLRLTQGQKLSFEIGIEIRSFDKESPVT